MFAELFRDEVSHCNVCLLVIRVSWDLNQLHAVEQGCRDGCRGVCCGDEQHLREVKGHVQVTAVSVKFNQCKRG